MMENEQTPVPSAKESDHLGDAFKEATATEPIMKYFAYSHLPDRLQESSRPFGELALFMFRTLPRSAERAAGLRKLLEAKDCAVRAALP